MRTRYVKAEVWRTPVTRAWMVQVYEPSRNRPHESDAKRQQIVARSKPVGAVTSRHRTHEAALAHALAEVGLAGKRKDR